MNCSNKGISSSGLVVTDERFLIQGRDSEKNFIKLSKGFLIFSLFGFDSDSFVEEELEITFELERMPAYILSLDVISVLHLILLPSTDHSK